MKYRVGASQLRILHKRLQLNCIAHSANRITNIATTTLVIIQRIHKKWRDFSNFFCQFQFVCGRALGKQSLPPICIEDLDTRHLTWCFFEPSPKEMLIEMYLLVIVWLHSISGKFHPHRRIGRSTAVTAMKHNIDVFITKLLGDIFQFHKSQYTQDSFFMQFSPKILSPGGFPVVVCGSHVVCGGGAGSGWICCCRFVMETQNHDCDGHSEEEIKTHFECTNILVCDNSLKSAFLVFL